MSRRKEVPKRQITLDPKYRDETVAKFINLVMRAGKKSSAEKIVYRALGKASATASGGASAAASGGAPAATSRGAPDKDPKGAAVAAELEIFKTALQNVKPRVEVKSRRVGGATYQVPVEVRPVRQLTLAMRWVIEAARKRGSQSMTDKLAAELADAYANKGAAIKRREDTLKMAEANKAFSHYRW